MLLLDGVLVLAPSTLFTDEPVEVQDFKKCTDYF